MADTIGVMKAMIFDYNRTIYNPDKDQLTDGAMDVLEILRAKGVALFLIAKGDEERRRRIVSLGIEPFFQRIIVNQQKSADDYRICAEANPPGTEVFAVGDRVKEEIRHANSCDISTIWFRNGKFASEFPADEIEQPLHTVTSLREVLSVVLPMHDLEDYYRKRAQEYEEIYHRPDPVRQQEQREIADAIREFALRKHVLEVACGTGYWTEVAAKTAAHILAVDAAPEMLAVAKTKQWPGHNVDFQVGDAYALGNLHGSFDAGLSLCWFSHIPKARITDFLGGFHAALQDGAVVCLADNVFVEGVGGVLVRKPGLQDTFKVRTLSDGTSHEILKNYYVEAELREMLVPFATDVRITMGNCFWRVEYRTARKS